MKTQQTQTQTKEKTSARHSKTITSDRHSLESLAKGSHGDKNGRLFTNDFGIHDLSNVQIVGASVDTIRQLYHGIPNSELVDKFSDHLGDYIDFKLPVYGVGNRPLKVEFHLSRMGKVSRYRWKLQNNKLGVVVLIGSYFAKMDIPGQHLKIELSPKFISQRSSQTIMDTLDYINNFVLLDGVPKGCAVHLSCDYQGFQLPENFLDMFQTHARIVKSYDGLNTLDISNLSESVATYGKAENRNYLIGKPASIQITDYDKTKEIVKSDKQDYFQAEWQAYTFGGYDPDKTVRRLEVRVSHTVIREIGQGIGQDLESFLQVSEYLTDIWRYALEKNRFLMAKNLLHPFWQLLLQDVFFILPAKGIKITRKKKESLAAIQRNVSQILGNLISICARNPKTTPVQVLASFRRTFFYEHILDAYRERGCNEADILDIIEKGLRRRRMIGKAA
jgi:hypothetical protein